MSERQNDKFLSNKLKTKQYLRIKIKSITVFVSDAICNVLKGEKWHVVGCSKHLNVVFKHKWLKLRNANLMC